MHSLWVPNVEIFALYNEIRGIVWSTLYILNLCGFLRFICISLSVWVICVKYLNIITWAYCLNLKNIMRTLKALKCSVSQIESTTEIITVAYLLLLQAQPSLLIYSALKTLSTLAENNAAIIGLKALTIIVKKYLEWNAPSWILVVVRIMMALFLEQIFMFERLSWDPAGFSIYNHNSYSVDCCKIQYFSCKKI